MGLFNRKPARAETGSTDDSTTAEQKKEKGGWKRPANTAFKQQRLKAWQPILTPKTVLPTFFFLGIIFAPIGAFLLWGSGKITEITLDYTHCEDQTPATDLSDSSSFHDISSYSYKLKSGQSSSGIAKPQYAYLNPSSDNQTCVIRFAVPYDLPQSVFLYYKLSNFFQNHRRYVKSLESGQLTGDAKTADDLNNSGNCKPLATRLVNNQPLPIYPCGLIANSQFNDTIGTTLTAVNAGKDYAFSESGIAWPGEANKYTDSPKYSDDWSKVAVPPNWDKRYPNGYNSSSYPKLASDQHFQNWMRTAGLPTFTKLYGRNDNTPLTKGTYEVSVLLNFPVKPYTGTKSLVISTVSWIGGKNPFLGWAYVGAAALFFLLGILGTIRHLAKPRQLGDMSLLSWNR